jgi:hypothetical protein
MTVLPRRSWRSRSVANAHRSRRRVYASP